VIDFLKVPPDRLAACLEEFRDFLEVARDFADLAKSVGQVIGADGAIDVRAFVWTDDEKRERTVTLVSADEAKGEA
jgi:hypothetical protein